jgi:predicted nucleotide-binding protein
VFGLGGTTIEALEQAVMEYQFGVFVFTPDDQLLSHGQAKPVARDNVVFEAGLFIGKLTRWRAFVVRPRGAIVVLPSDFQGITTAEYDPAEPDLATALDFVCQKIREAVDRTLESSDE